MVLFPQEQIKYSKFVVRPLEGIWYPWQLVGKILLSSLEGAAITSVKIEGVLSRVFINRRCRRSYIYNLKSQESLH